MTLPSKEGESRVKTYSLAEVADMVLPAEWTDSVRWLARRLNRGEIRGYKVGHSWRMTEQDVEQLIERYSNKPVAAHQIPATSTNDPPIRVVDGLSPRSRRRLDRSA